eukprot:TRINITY_DN77974_c0_g1_i1.p1 TRINITY_DN77974_c0_g1~~TRINITY_DN77974_c0_g1_i1.p1  ORF type:complete len:184 (-),score=33.32 TRINITY_DN77974_c0_g1_i1:26-577(-)
MSRLPRVKNKEPRQSSIALTVSDLLLAAAAEERSGCGDSRRRGSRAAALTAAAQSAALLVPPSPVALSEEARREVREAEEAAVAEFRNDRLRTFANSAAHKTVNVAAAAKISNSVALRTPSSTALGERTRAVLRVRRGGRDWPRRRLLLLGILKGDRVRCPLARLSRGGGFVATFVQAVFSLL